MKFIPYNLNNPIRVRLTNLGVRHYQEYWGEINDDEPYRPDPRDGEGWAEFQLWEFARIFGDKCGASSPEYFAPACEIAVCAAMHALSSGEGLDRRREWAERDWKDEDDD